MSEPRCECPDNPYYRPGATVLTCDNCGRWRWSVVPRIERLKKRCAATKVSRKNKAAMLRALRSRTQALEEENAVYREALEKIVAGDEGMPTAAYALKVNLLARKALSRPASEKPSGSEPPAGP